MVKSKEKVQKIDSLIDRLTRVLDALKEIRDNDVCEQTVLKKHGLDSKTFRHFVYDTDWDARHEQSKAPKRKGVPEKWGKAVPTKSWAEDLFCDVYCIRTPNIPVPDDTKERFMEVLPDLPNGLSNVLLALYRDGMTLQEAGQELGKSAERIRQLKEHALRMLRKPSRGAYMLMDYDGTYISKKRLEELRLKAEKDYQYKYLKKEIERFDRILASRKNAMNNTPERIPLENLDAINIHLSVRVYNALKRANVQTLGDILAMTFEDVKNIRNMGNIATAELVDELGKAGFMLANEEDEV